MGEKVKIENKNNQSRLTIKHIDLGKIGGWGRPLSYLKEAVIFLIIQTIFGNEQKNQNWYWLMEDLESVVFLTLL